MRHPLDLIIHFLLYIFLILQLLHQLLNDQLVLILYLRWQFVLVIQLAVGIIALAPIGIVWLCIKFLFDTRLLFLQIFDFQNQPLVPSFQLLIQFLNVLLLQL